MTLISEILSNEVIFRIKQNNDQIIDDEKIVKYIRDFFDDAICDGLSRDIAEDLIEDGLIRIEDEDDGTYEVIPEEQDEE